MYLYLRIVKILGILMLVLAATSCGGGGNSGSGSGSGSSSSGSGSSGSTGSGSSGSGSGGSGGALTEQQRGQAATTTAGSDLLCTSLTPFYWEIGDASGPLVSGTGGDGSSTPPTSGTLMAIASASKWIFSSYALERLNISSTNKLTTGEIQYLNFTSGYDNQDDTSCFAQHTVAACFGASNSNGGLNSDQHSTDIGHFFYNGGHMQAMAMNQFSLGGDYTTGTAGTPKLASDIQSYVGQDFTLYYSNPSLAGGADTTASDYAIFLRKILDGELRIKDYLGTDAVCAHANSTDCPTAIYSPVDQAQPGDSNNVSDEAWHYSLGHWVEDDPTVGDGAFSSPGADGFYPWIDSSKTYYGIIARYDPDTLVAPAKEPYVLSVYCGRAIRKAWLTGQAQ